MTEAGGGVTGGGDMAEGGAGNAHLKIAAPVSSPREVEMLLHCGADELYCGLHTPEWEAHAGGGLWMNRRSPKGANLGSWHELEEVAAQAHAAGAGVHLTLNAPFYTERGSAYLLDLAQRLAAAKLADGLIVSDLDLLLRLSRLALPLRLHLSSLGGCINSEAVAFYRSLGVARIILPRQMTLGEIREIVTRNRDRMAFEVFALNDGCFFEEGFCQTLHALGGPFCLAPWQVEARGEPVAEAQMEDLRKRMGEYLWYLDNCGSSFQQDGLPNGPCSLCQFGVFRKWGVSALKVVGREASFLRKMRSLQLVKAVADVARRGAPAQEVAGFARDLRRTPDYCDSGCMCYFRD